MTRKKIDSQHSTAPPTHRKLPYNVVTIVECIDGYMFLWMKSGRTDTERPHRRLLLPSLPVP